ncbi:(+)-gamma-cadinene synthase-like [Prosopis cineraria]|uniref:(+)-gamma-cadinene synthase-like n=1 Tax=Prosopis cineraria TaxID=364024 RepID=UPI00240F305B|nr:(+)-gamma-cadinene synthase-like [Prosopis cineraria]
MSIVASSSLLVSPSNPKTNATSKLDRQSADFHPCLWNDYFLQYASDDLEVGDEMKKNIETLKEEVREMLISTMETPLKKAEVVESIQCLGLSYHFELEIDQILKQIQNDCVENNEITLTGDLHSLALLFKLLRQHGYLVSPAKLKYVLKQCPYRGIQRLEARKYISIYHLHPSYNEVLLTLAKLDFNALQKLHRKEFGNICKWDISCLEDLQDT